MAEHSFRGSGDVRVALELAEFVGAQMGPGLVEADHAVLFGEEVEDTTWEHNAPFGYGVDVAPGHEREAPTPYAAPLTPTTPPSPLLGAIPTTIWSEFDEEAGELRGGVVALRLRIGL